MTAVVRLVVSTDERYAMPTAACIRSVIDSRDRTDPLHITVLANAVSERTRTRLLRSWRAARCAITITPVDLGRFASLPTTSAVGATVTAAVYAPLLIGELLPADWQRVIYLDSDTITRRPLNSLWNTDLRGSSLGAVRDDYVPTVSSPYGVPGWRELGLAADLPYFNSGVLLIDLDAWRRQRIGEKAVQYLTQHAGDIRLFDQDALNAVCAGRWHELDTPWNVTGYWRKPERRTGRYRTILEDARIRHFAGYGKPWDPDPLPGVTDAGLFFHSLARTAWASTDSPEDGDRR
ncbi:glycosyltransferase family 8 protein [Paractinoplanes toevensis]|uniref:Glycosyl transferase family 8 n=1 Tax=Paractinoplanes toevensis TaxID=571911 RepID=A0A919W6C2_9ACTN|nr:glycosyltransferase family 8 protein [Actinoplanes toevensis]GIM94385.1 glycosyl transferase family 8 [Actinoplanes toevensis]